MDNVEPTEVNEELEIPLDIDDEIVETGEIVYVDISFTNGSSMRLRIPTMVPVDERNDNMITYQRIVDQVDSAFNAGSEGHIQLPYSVDGNIYSSMFFALSINVNNITVHPPVWE